MLTDTQSETYSLSKLDDAKLKRIRGYIKANREFDPVLKHIRDSVSQNMHNRDWDYWTKQPSKSEYIKVREDIIKHSNIELDKLIQRAQTEHGIDLANLLVTSEDDVKALNVLSEHLGNTKEQVAYNNDAFITARVLDIFQQGRFEMSGSDANRTEEKRFWELKGEGRAFKPFTGNILPVEEGYMQRFLEGHDAAVKRTQQQADTTTDQPSVDTDQTSDTTTTTTDIEKIKAVALKNNEPYEKVVAMVHKADPKAIRNSVLNPAMSIFSEPGQTVTGGKFRITNEGDKFSVYAYTRTDRHLFEDRELPLTGLASAKYIPNFKDIPEGPIKNDMRLIADELFSIVDKYDNPERVFGGLKTITGRARRGSFYDRAQATYDKDLDKPELFSSSGKEAALDILDKDLENDRVMVSRILDVIDLPGLGDLNEVRSFLTQVREDTLSQNKETTVPSILANPVDMDSIISLIKLEEALLPNTSADSYSKVGGKYVRNPGGKNVPLTGGYGHLLTAAERKQYPEGMSIPQWQIDKWFKEDLKKAYDAAVAQNKQLSKPIDIARLTSVNFQLGTGWHKDHDETWKALVAGDYDLAAEEIKERSKWYTQTPSRADAFIEAILSLKP
jgi:hypothetical protein